MDINISNPVTNSKIGEVVNASTAATPNDTDLVTTVESSVVKKITWTNVKAFLKTYFDTIYQAAGSYLTSANIDENITNGVTDKAPSQNAVFDALALKVDKTSWVDWTASLGVTGFSSTTILFSQYKVVDNDIVLFEAEVTGTSNATGFTITLPFALSNTLFTGNMAYIPYIVNNGTAAAGTAVIAVGSTTLTIYRDVISSVFTASGTKAVRLQIFYRK